VGSEEGEKSVGATHTLTYGRTDERFIKQPDASTKNSNFWDVNFLYISVVHRTQSYEEMHG